MNWFWWKKKKESPHGDYYPESLPYVSHKGGRRKFIPDNSPQKYYLPFSVLKSTNDVFKTYANHRAEAYAWWAGYIANGNMAQICTVLYPNVKTRYGHIHLNRQILGSMHRRLIDFDQILLAELHTHPPGAGGQNDVDAANSTLFYNGFKAIVVPDFGLPNFYDLRRCHVYSYISDSRWYEMEAHEIPNCFVIDEICSEVNPQ